MRRKRGIHTGTTAGVAALLLIVGVLFGPARADDFSVRVWNGNGFETVDFATLAGETVDLETTDPNFSGDGKKTFTGIRLSSLMPKNSSGMEEKGLTVIGADQYVGFVTPVQVLKGLLAWEADGEPIAGIRGGPLKLVFPEDASVHASCYTWYVESLVWGQAAGASFSVTARGKKIRVDLSRLTEIREALPPMLFSIPQGCRTGLSEKVFAEPVRAVRYSRLLERLSLPGAERTVTFELNAGDPVRLSKEALAFDAYIIIGCGSLSLHPSLGGPYSIVFPVEDHPQLKNFVPESGALFFLKGIVLD